MKKTAEELSSLVFKRYRVSLPKDFDLSGRDPDESGIGKLKKKDEKKLAGELQASLSRLQGLLYAEARHKVLIILQGMDTSGKDGTIAHVFQGINPEGVQVASFKVPTQEESDHDYLWRIHKAAPRKGQIVVFNRSHYEDVIVTRVHGLVPPQVWKRRYAQISDFERMLTEEGTVILKFFLLIDKDEQKKRLEQRLADPEKNWKFSGSDLKERKLWPQYMRAYQDAIRETSTSWAPWFVIPANKKWHRDLSVSLIIIETLKALNMRYPKRPARKEQL